MSTPADPYRSRTSGSWDITERRDPTIWGGGEGLLSDEELRRFDRDGFILCPNLLSMDEAASLLDEAQRLAMETSATTTVAEAESNDCRSSFGIHERSLHFAGLVRDARIAGIATQILGSATYVHQSRINHKRGLTGKGFAWHSDFETWHTEDGMPRMRCLSASVFLTDNDQINGPLLVIPGSHKCFIRCPGPTPTKHYETSLRAQIVGIPPREAIEHVTDSRETRQVTGSAGSVVFFDCNVLHGSADNLAPADRCNAFIVLNSIFNQLSAPFGGTAPRPEFLAARDITAIVAP